MPRSSSNEGQRLEGRRRPIYSFSTAQQNGLSRVICGWTHGFLRSRPLTCAPHPPERKHIRRSLDGSPSTLNLKWDRSDDPPTPLDATRAFAARGDWQRRKLMDTHPLPRRQRRHQRSQPLPHPPTNISHLTLNTRLNARTVVAQSMYPNVNTCFDARVPQKPLFRHQPRKKGPRRRSQQSWHHVCDSTLHITEPSRMENELMTQQTFIFVLAAVSVFT